MSLRAVRSPVAPKTTTAQASGVRWRRMPCAERVDRLRRVVMRFAASAGLHGVAAELVAQGRLHLRAERRRLARGEAPHQRERDDRQRHVLVERLLHRPAALAGVLDVAADRLQPRVALERALGELEQPGADDGAVLPERRDLVQIEVEAASRRAARSPHRRRPSCRTRCRCGPSSRSGRRRSGRRARIRRSGASVFSAGSMCAKASSEPPTIRQKPSLRPQMPPLVPAVDDTRCPARAALRRGAWSRGSWSCRRR